MLVNEQLNYDVPAAFIKFEQTGDLVKLEVTDLELGQVKETIKQINRIIDTEVMPQPTEFAKRCKDCCYWKICKRA